MNGRRLSVGLGACFALVVFGCGSRREEPAPTVVEQASAQAPVVNYLAPTTPKGSETISRFAPILTAARAYSPPKLEAEIADLTTDGVTILATPAGSKAQAVSTRVRIPKVGDGAMRVETTGMAVEVRPVGLKGTPIEWHEQIAVYPDVSDGVDAIRVVANDGVEDLYRISSARTSIEFTYQVKLEGVAGLRLVSGSLEMLDAKGTPRLRAPEPVAFDSAGVARTGALHVVGCSYDTAAIGPWGRPVTAPGASTCTVVAKVDARNLQFPVVLDPAWQGTENTKRTHAYHRLVRIENGADKGKVLLVGGTGTAPSITELFDPTTKTWATSSSLLDGGAAVTLGIGSNAVGLPDGTVLATGGFPAPSGTSAQATAMRRNPATGLWSGAASMSAGRAWHMMVPMKNGTVDGVLVIGGQPQSSIFSSSTPHKSVEWWNPGSGPDGSWTGMAAMSGGRTQGRAVVLGDGRILVAGGINYTTTTQYLSSAEIFSPTSKTWASAGTMSVARVQPELIALAGTGATAVIAGGNTTTSTFSSTIQDSIEYFNGTTWAVLPAKLSVPRWNFASARLDDGRVLFTGGQTYSSVTFTSAVIDSADLLIPGSNPVVDAKVAGAGTMSYGRQYHDMINVPGVGVLAAGGLTSTSTGTETASSELFNTAIGGACSTTGPACPTGLKCVDGVCCDVGSATSCPSGQKCNNPGREGVCTKANGATCGSNLECASGYCVGGFCCETACSGGCKSCDATGKCILAAAGTDPGNFCAGSGDPTCSRKCDGTGKCSSTYPAEGTKCGASLGDGGIPFCDLWTCTGWGSCTKKTNNCGLTCTTTVSCNETTKTCTPIATGIKPGFCVIDSTCYAYGDLNPKDSCQVCDPPTSKTSWSTAVSCTDGGVVDTGIEDTEPEDTGAEDTGSEDTGAPDTTTDDTGSAADTSVDDASEDAAPVGSDLPTQGTCGCRTPGNDNGSAAGAIAALGLAIVVGARRRKH